MVVPQPRRAASSTAHRSPATPRGPQITASYPNAKVVRSIGPNVGTGGTFTRQRRQTSPSASPVTPRSTTSSGVTCTTDLLRRSGQRRRRPTPARSRIRRRPSRRASTLVQAGGTVDVRAGTYAEDVVVTKTAHIQGAGATTIVQPGHLDHVCVRRRLAVRRGGHQRLPRPGEQRGDRPPHGGRRQPGCSPACRSAAPTWTPATASSRTTRLGTVQRALRPRRRPSRTSTSGASTPPAAARSTSRTTSSTTSRATPASIGIFNFNGGGTIADNDVSNANDAIASNWSDGTQFTGNTVTSSGSGVHTDNAGAYPGGHPGRHLGQHRLRLRGGRLRRVDVRALPGADASATTRSRAARSAWRCSAAATPPRPTCAPAATSRRSASPATPSPASRRARACTPPPTIFELRRPHGPGQRPTTTRITGTGTACTSRRPAARPPTVDADPQHAQPATPSRRCTTLGATAVIASLQLVGLRRRTGPRSEVSGTVLKAPWLITSDLDGNCIPIMKVGHADAGDDRGRQRPHRRSSHGEPRPADLPAGDRPVAHRRQHGDGRVRRLRGRLRHRSRSRRARSAAEHRHPGERRHDTSRTSRTSPSRSTTRPSPSSGALATRASRSRTTRCRR